MADIFDRASELEAQQRADALARQREKTPRGRSRVHCGDCGGRIPEERRRALPGVQRCVDCQETAELMERGR